MKILFGLANPWVAAFLVIAASGDAAVTAAARFSDERFTFVPLAQPFPDAIAFTWDEEGALWVQSATPTGRAPEIVRVAEPESEVQRSFRLPAPLHSSRSMLIWNKTLYLAQTGAIAQLALGSRSKAAKQF